MLPTHALHVVHPTITKGFAMNHVSIIVLSSSTSSNKNIYYH